MMLDAHTTLSVFSAVVLAGLATTATPTSAASEEVTFRSNGYMLHGCLTPPRGSGPFPVIIYNHGSEKEPDRCGPQPLARNYVDYGYLFFSFERHGHGQSPGDYIMDQLRRIQKEDEHDPVRQGQRITALHESYNPDVIGAVAWLMERPEIDRTRVVMTGISHGGIQTLLTADSASDIRAFIAFAPGAIGWPRNQALRNRLELAVRNAKVPLFLAQAQNDYSIGPSEVLGPIVRAKGPPSQAKLYPPFGNTPQAGHGDFAAYGGVPIWRSDVFNFLDRVMK
jgi:carboxymethylenebutenolidase